MFLKQFNQLGAFFKQGKNILILFIVLNKKINKNNKTVFQKAANSNLDRLKSRLFGKNDLSTLSPFRKSKN